MLRVAILRGRAAAEREERGMSRPRGQGLCETFSMGEMMSLEAGTRRSLSTARRHFVLYFLPFSPFPLPPFVVSQAGSNTSPLIPTIPHGDSPFQRMAWIPANAEMWSGRALVQNIPCQGKMRGFLPSGGPEPPRGGSFVWNRCRCRR